MASTWSMRLGRIALHDAEDLVQETYVVMVRQWRRIDWTNPEPYVRRIMYTTVRRWLAPSAPGGAAHGDSLGGWRLVCRLLGTSTGPGVATCWA